MKTNITASSSSPDSFFAQIRLLSSISSGKLISMQELSSLWKPFSSQSLDEYVKTHLHNSLEQDMELCERLLSDDSRIWVVLHPKDINDIRNKIYGIWSELKNRWRIISELDRY